MNADRERQIRVALAHWVQAAQVSEDTRRRERDYRQIVLKLLRDAHELDKTDTSGWPDDLRAMVAYEKPMEDGSE